MTLIPFCQIDAFAAKPFEGNQACVMPLEEFLPDTILQAIAAENNVSETAFIVPAGKGVWDLRWFTPALEVPMCGHATLAASHYLFADSGFAGEHITFRSRQSGELYVSRLADGRIEMDFPAPDIRQIELDPAIVKALGGAPFEAWAGPFHCALFETPEEIYALTPDVKTLGGLGENLGWGRGNFGCLATGGADGAEITSRFFAPGSGIDEDPATGSWHTMIAAVMAARSGQMQHKCYQAYPGRGAWIETELAGNRVKLRGLAVTVIEGAFHL